MLNRAKKVFKRKPKRDRVIEMNEKGDFILKDKRVPFKLEPIDDLPANMKIHTKFIGRKEGSENLFVFEVCGVILESEDLLSAQRKYLRQKGL